MSETITGSIEILIEGESVGLTVAAATVATVPIVVQAIYGYTNVTPAEPQERAGRLPLAEWTATTPAQRTARIVLWPEPAFDETAIGRALAAAREGTGNGEG